MTKRIRFLVAPLLVAPLLSGCAILGAKLLDPEEVTAAVERMDAKGLTGCAYLRGHANPPGAQLDLDIVYATGSADYLACLKALKP